MLGYVVKIQNSKKTLFLFKKSPSVIPLRKRNRLAFFDEGTLKLDTGSYISISADFDAATLFAEGPPHATPLYVFNFSRFESLFSFKERYKDDIQLRQKNIASFLEDSDSFVKSLTDDVRQLRKMSRIVKFGTLSNMNVNEIKKTIDDYGLGLTLNNQGKIKYSKQKVWTVLRLLNDDYLSSSCTGIKYEARSKLKHV